MDGTELCCFRLVVWGYGGGPQIQVCEQDRGGVSEVNEEFDD